MRQNAVIAILTILLLWPLSSISAQGYENRSVAVSQLNELKLPALLDDMFMLDGKLHISSAGMLFTIASKNGKLRDIEVDTAMLAIDPAMLYAVRHPQTGSLFFTKPDSRGNSSLYEYYDKKGGKYAVRHIRPARFSYSIEHPVFTPDGRIMVFASDCPLGFGGIDLWYSIFIGGEWQYPQNLGHRINTVGDDKSPALYGDFMVYSTNGKEHCRGGYDLFAARLIALEQTSSDTVMMFPIGRCQAFSLEAPFCSREDDLTLILNEDLTGGYWLKHHEARDSNDNSHDTFFRFQGELNSVMLLGRVKDSGGETLRQATVTVRQEGSKEYTVQSDDEGQFTIFLTPGEPCNISVSARDFFANVQNLTPVRYNEEHLYSTQALDVTMQTLPIGKVLSYSDLFRSSVTSELSPAGRAHVDSIAAFLVQNPHLGLMLASTFNMSEDMPFCSLLNQSRLRSITDRLVSKGVSLTVIESTTDRPEGMTLQLWNTTNESPAEASSKTVFFTIHR